MDIATRRRRLFGLEAPDNPTFTLLVLAVCLLWLALPSCAEEEVVWPTRAELTHIVETASQVSDSAVRAEVVRLAARTGLPELTPLIQAAAEDPDALVVAAAFENALRKGDDAQIAALNERLLNGSEAARRIGLELTLSYAPMLERTRALEQALRQPNASVRRFAIRRILSDRQTDAAVAETVLGQLLDMGDPTIAAEVADLLMFQGETERLHSVYERLLSEDETERLSAMRVFAVAPSFDIWPYLRWHRQNGERQERDMAMLGLARLGDNSVSGELRDMLLAGDPELIPLAIRALAGLSNPDDLRQLSSYRSDTRPEVRSAVARTLMALNTPPEELVDFIEDRNPEVANLVTQYLIGADVGAFQARICSQLRLSSNPLPLLRFIWLLKTESHSDVLIDACDAQLQSLLDSANGEVRYIAARLHYSVVPPSPSEMAAELSDDHSILYAYLEASLDWNPDEFRSTYLDLLEHELVIVRVLASMGLLKTTAI